MNLTHESYLKLHPLNIREDKKNFIVEDQFTGEFFEMPAICVHALEMMENGARLFEIEKELKAIYPQEEVNVLEFAQQLIEMEIIQEVDGKTVGINKRDQIKSGFLWIPQRLAKIFFNQFSLFIYFILFIINIAFFMINPQLFPHYKDLLVFDVMVANILFYMVLTFVLLLVHEFGHVLALRSVGQPAKIEIGHRLFLVVLETDMSKVWGLPPKKRTMLYLGGLCFDNLVLFLALLTALLLPGHAEIGRGIVGMMVLDIMIRMIYQCFIYMKTDLYHVLENATGCYNLMENSRAYFGERFNLTKFKAEKEIFAGEKPIVISYGIFYLVSMLMTFLLFIFYFIPFMIYVVNESIHCMMMTSRPEHFWDGTITLLQLLISVGLLLYSWRKKYKLKSNY